MALTMMISRPDPGRRRRDHGAPPGRAAVGVLVVIIPIMALLIGAVMSRAIPLFQAMQVKLDRINLVMRETLAGVRVIRAFVRTRHEEERFDEASRDLIDTGAPGQPAVRDHPPGADGDHEPVDGGGHVVRAPTASTAARCRSAT